MRTIIVTLLTILPWVALGIGIAGQNMRFEFVDNKNGLSNNTVQGIVQDSRGFIWISTVNGLNRYDGENFVVMQPIFERPSLAESRVRAVYEDRGGRLWIHTLSGILNYYDLRREKFTEFLGEHDSWRFTKMTNLRNGDVWVWGQTHGACHIQFMKDGTLQSRFFNRNNIGTSIVNFVYEDSSCRVWIGTDKGLVLIEGNTPVSFPGVKESMSYQNAIEIDGKVHFITDNNRIVSVDRTDISKVSVRELNLDGKFFSVRQSALLEGTTILIISSHDICAYDVADGTKRNVESLFGLPRMDKASLLTDNLGGCWIFNGSGNIWRYDPIIKRFRKFELIPPHLMSVIDMERYSVHCGSQGITWITTYGNGLFALEEKTGRMSHYTTKNSPLRTNYLLTVAEDNAEGIWIGTEYTGVTRISFADYNIDFFRPSVEQGEQGRNTVRALFEDENFDLWVGTKDGSVHIYDESLAKKSQFTLQKGIPYCFASDPSGKKWVGTKGGGLILLSEDGRHVEQVFPVSGDSERMANNNIFSLMVDQKGEVWIGTFGNGLRSCRLKNGHVRFRDYPYVSNTQKFIRCLLQDRKGRIWVGGNMGVSLFDPEQIRMDPNNMRTFTFRKDDPTSLNNNIVKAIFEDRQGNIWIGTDGGGLSRVEEDSSGKISFSHFSYEAGLGNLVIQTILEGDNGDLWLSTENGISKFDTRNRTFENYSFSDDWAGRLFYSSCFREKSGELVFGSHDGVYKFDPEKLVQQTHIPPVLLTDFAVNGVSAVPGIPESPLSESITGTKSVILKSWQNSFNIKFALLNYQESNRNMYTYILENYEKAWNPVSRYNVANYRNIPPGKYVFRVRGCNAAGKWTPVDTELHITVELPFWLTWPAIVLYVILAGSVAFFSLRLILQMNRLHNAVEVEKQLTEYKLRFFTNISHEFRTPLSIIRGTIESMESDRELNAKQRKHLKTLLNSSLRLMRLIDQLLEFRRIQNGKLELHMEPIAPGRFFREIFDMFSDAARSNRIDYLFSIEGETGALMFDRGKMDKVVYNLLSNAFKHTPAGGRIRMEVKIDRASGILVLRVMDSGIGIPPEKRDLLFKRFQQINYTQGGIGIGLHLTAELVAVHRGTIEYKDIPTGGACFEVTIPAIDAPADGEVRGECGVSLLEDPDTDLVSEKEMESLSNAERRYKVLIIEDDTEIREFLQEQYAAYFQVSTAINGSEGLEMAVNEQPDLIICDVMMPLMDGFEVTKRLRADIESSHIPIILVTAHSSMEHRLTGVEAGADDYITKPFSIRYLLLRSAKIIEQRQMLRNKFANTPGLAPEKICVNWKDNELMDKVHRIIEENLGNPDFCIDDFAKSLGMSRTLFYKKIKGITGESPNEYLRIVRLKKGAEYLLSDELHISEIAYRVGFNDPDYFGRCFRKQMGVSPKQYRKMRNGNLS